ncbi:MAG: hypothetical protein MUP98_18040 [Candidatus Aminicenantes bacterium]|nr:hypothetical protein [Candidatus Aminicenantes bacterium]
MKKFFTLPLFAIFMLAFFFSSGQKEVIAGHEAPSLQQSQVDRVEEDVEVIVPGPTDIKQTTAIYVFLGWIWLSIGVLIFFLRLKIKEVDRLHDLGFFTKDKD